LSSRAFFYLGPDKQISIFSFRFRYYLRDDGEACMRYVNGTRLDDRIIRTDWDAGFSEGRQYGRGKTGGQVKKVSLLNWVSN
jgi:hypothetical protein